MFAASACDQVVPEFQHVLPSRNVSNSAAEVTVLVADDQILVRAGIAALLRELPGVRCLEPVSDGASCLQACAQAAPDVLLLDLQMPPDDGWQVAAEVRQRHPLVRIVILTSSVDPALARRALDLGCVGFISKDFVLDELAMALRSVVAGRPYLSPSVAMAAMQQPALEAPVHLSPRQRQVLAAIARGSPNKQIARDMGLSVKTVAYHRAELIQRLDLHDVASLTRYAMAQGLLD